ncbi:MAG TPA: FtsX-like permease family protein, partial [Streptosporangiaceae bacterium]|nr:FtsX-like permease family protein [Streptosporangiaceae bacterium]
ELGFFTVHGKPTSPSGPALAFVPGFALIIVGLALAGPWLTMATARVMARRTSRPGTLIAARRLADDPSAAFRAVSGLVLALFITTVAVVGITTWNAQQHNVRVSAAEAKVLTDQLAYQQPGSASQASAGPAAPAAPLAAELSGTHGVQGVVVVRAIPRLTIPATLLDYSPGPPGSSPVPVPAGVVSCAQLATVPVLGRCPAGATAAAFPADGFAGPLYGVDATGITWPAANVAATRLDSLAVDAINVMTNGTVPAVEQARTVLENAHSYAAYLGDGVPSTVGELIAQSNPTNSGYQQLANVVILVSLPIAGCTLAAGIAAGLADRKRPFSLLRLTGARLVTLRQVVALESAVPLLAVAAVAVGTGFGAAAMYTSLEMQHPMVAPGAAYYLLTAGGILAALGIIAATFPLLKRITGPEVARNE